MNLRILAASLSLVGLISSSVACSSADQITTTLELAIDAATVALPIVAQAAGLAPETASAVTRYLGDVNQATIAAAPVLDNRTLSPAAQASAITDAFATIATPELPAGTPANVAAAIQAVAQAVSQFLGQMKIASSEIQFGDPRFVNAFTRTQRSKIDRRRLKRIRQKAEALNRALATAK